VFAGKNLRELPFKALVPDEEGINKNPRSRERKTQSNRKAGNSREHQQLR
jgi:hypothetical protein